MVKKFLIVFFLAPLSALAQVLLPTAQTAFGPQHNFNPEVIKKNGVKKIVFEILDKKDFEAPVDKNLVETYEFNADGLLTRHYFTNIVKTVERQVTKVHKTRRGTFSTTDVVRDYVYDTVSTTFFYSGKNLVLKRYHDGGNYYESRYYRYDSFGNLTRELRYRETNNSPDKSVFILGNQLQLSEDSFQYVRFSSGQVKCIFLNNENRPYKEKISNSDSLKQVVSEFENYTVASWIRQESRYEYSGRRLITARFEGNANNSFSLKNTYEYDQSNELYTEKQYKNNVLVKEISYVSDRNTGLLNSFIIRDPSVKSLRIVKLKYDYGMIGKE